MIARPGLGVAYYPEQWPRERWEPRITVEDVEVTFDSREEGKLYIDVRYSLRGTNDPRNLVFPFYLIPEHEGSAPSSVPAQELPAAEGA